MLLPSIAFKVAVEYQTANINGADRRLIDLESNAGIADLPFAWALPQKRLQMNHSSMIKLLNGICIQLTHTEQALVSIRDCTKDILEEVHGMRVLNVDKADNQSDDAALEIKEFSCRIKSRCQSDLQYLHCIEKRAKNAIPAVSHAAQIHIPQLIWLQIFNLMAQRDTKLNLEVARDSKSLAAASKRDSSAMKSVAVVTIVFLPGTFLSVSLPVTASSLPSLPPQQSADTKKTLFAMPVFDWESSNGHLAVNNNFWIYWAFNVPLTVLTVAIWITWMRRDSLLKRRLEKEARASGGLGKPDEDDGSVADHDARFTGKRSQTDLGSRVWLEDLRRREKQQMGRPSMEPA
ncbi:MAG: hypothetical protein M1833_004060 [Piccolia ochrophora]|nr:MAG: hypothetical protein M1833_004060 [Piccolia ochrophora]